MRSHTDGGPSPEAVREQLDRILSSRLFSDSHRMIRFLRFVVESALRGESAALKEYLIGVEVFDRQPSYDPRVDPIVRVEARRLRSKLAAWYAAEGDAAAVRIDMPTGTYAPLFRKAASAPEPLPAARAEDPAKTIAVLPFTNLAPGTEGDYFSDGLTEELTHLLTKVPGLQVLSWSSTVRLRGDQTDLASMAEQLSADVILRGSVRRAQNRLRVMAQLIEARRGIVLWSESYDRLVTDLFSVQEEIATSIAHALQLSLIEAPRVRSASSAALDAYNLYLKGRYHWNTRTVSGLQESVRCFGQAIEADPRNALAYAGLADAWLILVEYGILCSQTLEKAEQAARKAIEIDPSLAEPYASLGLIRSIQWQWNESEDLYHRAISLNPSYATARHWLGVDCLAMFGRFDEAEESLAAARRLDPLSAIVFESSGLLQMLWGHYDEAMLMYEAMQRRDPSSARYCGSMGRWYLHQGRLDEAIEALETGVSKAPDVPSLLGALGQAYGQRGRHEDARRILEKLSTMAERRNVARTCFALVHAGLGEVSEAFAWLEESADRRDGSLLTIGVHPAYDSLRDHPRWRKLIRRIGREGVEERAASYRNAAR